MKSKKMQSALLLVACADILFGTVHGLVSPVDISAELSVIDEEMDTTSELSDAKYQDIFLEETQQKLYSSIHNEVIDDEVVINDNESPSKDIKLTFYNVPNYSGFKSWMDYRKITNKSSKAYKLQQYATTNEIGLRVVDGRYCVALGSYFNCSIGQYFDLILENDIVIPCIMGDQKADCHTDSQNIVTVSSGCMSEFIIDINSLNSKVKISGNTSNAYEGWNAKVVQVVVYDKNYFN